MKMRKIDEREKIQLKKRLDLCEQKANLLGVDFSLLAIEFSQFSFTSTECVLSEIQQRRSVDKVDTEEAK